MKFEAQLTFHAVQAILLWSLDILECYLNTLGCQYSRVLER